VEDPTESMQMHQHMLLNAKTLNINTGLIKDEQIIEEE